MRKFLLSLAISIPVLASGCIAGDAPSGPSSGPEGPGGSMTDPSPGSDDVGGPDGGVQLGTVSMEIDAEAVDLALGTEDVVTITITSVDGYTGPVEIVAAGGSPSWTAAIEPSTVSVSPGLAATATLHVAVPTNGDAGLQDIDIVATPLAPSRDSETIATTSVTVENVFYSNLPLGTQTGAHPWPRVTIQLGATVVFGSEDTGTAHRIHSNNDASGFPHESGELVGDATYAVTITDTGTFDFYCHNHDASSGFGRLTVVAP